MTHEITGNVLILGPVEPPVGGVSRYCRGLADLLGEGAVQIDLDRTSAEELGIQRSPVARLVKRVVGGPSFALRSAIAQHHPRLIVDNHQLLWRDRVHALRVREVVDCPYVLAIHDGAFPDAVRGVTTLERDLGWISGAVCMSDAIRAALEERVPGVPATRLSPLLTEAPVDGDGSWDEPLAGFLRGHETVIVTSGALAEHYGLTDVVQAFAALRERRPKTGLVLLLGSFADDAPEAAALRESIKAGGGDSVLMLSDFPDGGALIARGDAYVRPSRVDSFGLGLHEAMQAGVPVVAAAHETRPEGVRLYEPGNVEALTEAMEQALAPEAAEAARRLVPSVADGVAWNRRATIEFLSALIG